MRLFDWPDGLVTDVKTMDSQHSVLAKRINRFLRHCLDERCSRTDLLKTFDHLYSYVTEHFALEEELAREYDYGNAKLLFTEHSRLKAWVEKTGVDLDKRDMTGDFRMEINYFLVELLELHIRVVDKGLADHLHTLAEASLDQKLKDLVKGMWKKKH